MALDLGTLVAKLRVDNDMARGLADGRRDIDRFARDANGRLRDLRGRFVSESRAMGRGVGDGLDRSSRPGVGRFGRLISGASDLVNSAAKKAAAGVGQLQESFVKLVKDNPQMALGVVAGAIAGLPLVAGIAASAITVGLGGALAMVAIKAAASAKSVQDAFGDLKDDLQSGLRDAAAPFEDSLVRMIATARKELGNLGPHIGRAFAALAPAVEKAFGSVARAVGSLGPTLGYIAQQAAPLIETLGRELGGLVKSLAGDFQQLAAAADPRFITILVGAVKGLSGAFTELITQAAAAGSWILDLVGMDRPAVSARNLGDAFMETAAGAREATEAVEEANEAFAEHLDPSLKVFNATTDMREAFKNLRKSLDESKGSMEGNSDAALQSRRSLSGAIDSVREMYLAQRANGDSHDKARAAIQRQLNALERLAGDNKKARAQVDNLRRSLDQLKDKTVTVTVNTRGPGAGTANALQRFKNMADGGLVTGPGTSTSDSIPTRLSNGEYVLPASVVKRVGVKKLDALRRGGGGGLRDTTFGSGLQDFQYGELQDYEVGRGTGTAADKVLEAIRRKLQRAQAKVIEGQLKTLKAGLKRIREAREDLLEGLTSMSSDTVESTAKSLSEMVRKAFEGFRKTTTIDDRLLARISQTSKRLQALADQRAKIAEQLQEALNFAASVTSRAAGDASVLGIEVVDEDGNRVDPNAGELKTGLQARLATLRKFAGDIKTLAGQGLSKTVLRQLMEAGPEQAGALAAAIASGGQQAVNEITAVQNEIDAEAKNLGEFSADHLYDAGAKAGEGFLTGLTGQLEQLENTMETLANNLIKAVTDGIKKAQETAQQSLLTGAVMDDGRLQDAVYKKPKPKPKNDPNLRDYTPKASALTIQNYHEAPGGNSRRTAEELLLLTRSRG